MKLKLILALTSAITLSQCVVPGPAAADYPSRRHGRDYYEDLRDRSEDARDRRDLGPRHSDYQPELANSYRAGYSAGRRDRFDGYPRESHRAFMRWGGGYESYFQEGYADGYANNGMRH